MRVQFLVSVWLVAAGLAWSQSRLQDEFSRSIRPTLVQHCAACHNPTNPKNNFLQAMTAKDMEANRGLWRSVAAQLRNRTMPPVASKLTGEDRIRVADWIETQQRQTACSLGDYAGPAAPRRLNRREYHNTIRDLLGIDFDVIGAFPADGTGGAGFDTNGETLFIPPMLAERYLEAAQQILDRAIITPPIVKTVSASPSRSLAAGEEFPVNLSVYLEGDYDVQVTQESGAIAAKMYLKVDGAEVGALVAQAAAGRGGADRAGRGAASRLQVHLARGSRTLSIVAKEPVAGLGSITIRQRAEAGSPEKRALHYRLLGIEPGERPLQTRKAAQQVLATFLPRAFRRPVQPAEMEPFLKLYDRAEERGDPYEERMKLALMGVLVSPDFLFRMEQRPTAPGIRPLGHYELANRLSYFLWSTMPDEQLFRLAEQGRLQDPKVLAAQVDRMLDDSRSRAFISSFIGQWLGTQEIGGRVVPVLSEIQSYYSVDIAADLRSQPVLLFDRIVGENRSLLELINADYTHLTQRLAKFYQVEGQVKDLNDDEFHLVQWPDNRRAGILGLAGVLAMTSRYQETSPVLRGAWVLETLLGTPVPPPPPDVPPLKTGNTAKLAMRERLAEHRTNAVCATCHKLMDPIGFGLENFDWMGRWRDKEAGGQPVDAAGALPTGEAFNGPVELRQAMLARKDDFARHLTSKVLGYALGRSRQDGDSCTVQRLIQALQRDNYQARTLIREIVLSVPFRNAQAGVSPQPVLSKKALDVPGLNAWKQDAPSHLKQ